MRKCRVRPGSRTDLSKEQAYVFCSLAADFYVTQFVNGDKGSHGMLKKGVLILEFVNGIG